MGGRLGAVLEWRVAAMGTVVAAVRVADGRSCCSPITCGESPIAIYRVADYGAAVARLRALEVGEVREVEIPPGPCATFSLAGARLGVYELTRPQAGEHLAARASMS